MLKEIFVPVAILGGLGLLFGLMLGVASKIFKVVKDERIDKIVECLPGANCGGCGFSGCNAFAEAVVRGEGKVTGCPVGGSNVADEIADIMEVKKTGFVKNSARVMCAGTCDKAKSKYEYEGTMDCFAANRLGGGPKSCKYGCLGMGTCKDACPFGAITIENGVAKVNKEKCTACGKCTIVCPKNLIKIVPDSVIYSVLCNNHEKGAVSKNLCDVSCIGCKICEKNCAYEAITVTDNLAEINSEKCSSCGICVDKCPRKIIR